MIKNKDFPLKTFFSVTELAKTLGVSRVAIGKKIRNGTIRAEKVGRTYVIPKEEFAAALGQFVSEKRREQIDASIKKTVQEYGEALRRLGKE